MRTLPATLIAAASAVAIAGLAVAAQQPAAKTHTLTVRIPDGGVATITYTGDVAPRIALGPAPVAFPAPPPMARAFWPAFAQDAGDSQAMDAADSPFAMMRRISAQMDREAAALLAGAGAPGLATAGGEGFLPGAGGLAFASVGAGSGVCMRSVEITSNGDGRQPTVVRRASGDCAGGSASAPAPSGGAVTTVLPHAAAPDDGARLYRTTWRPAPGASRAPASEATLRTVSDAAD